MVLAGLPGQTETADIGGGQKVSKSDGRFGKCCLGDSGGMRIEVMVVRVVIVAVVVLVLAVVVVFVAAAEVVVKAKELLLVVAMVEVIDLK